MVKPYLSNNVLFADWINLNQEGDSLGTNFEEAAKELNRFFLSAVKNLNIRNYENHGS